MNVRVLGCHGSGQLVPGENGPVQCGTCGFLINEELLVDAGTVGSRLYLEEQRRIRLVLLTHLHFDHIRELPTLADNLVGEIEEPVVIAAIPEVLALTRKVPVVMLSGKDGLFDKVRGKLAGCNDYVTKPFDPDNLLKTIKKYLS